MREQKEILRKKLYQFKSELSDEKYREKSALISKNLSDFLEDRSDKIIASFYPMPLRKEIDIRSLLHRLSKQKVIGLPVIESMKERRMIFRSFSGVHQLVRNSWGIDEPVSGKIIAPREIDCMIAPCLGVDRQGYRIGYGGGFYDRYLKQLSIPIVTLAFEETIFEKLPHESHDIPVNHIITEQSTLRIL